MNPDVGAMVPGPEGSRPGAILAKWLELRQHVGVLKARKKDKVRFKVRSTDELIDKIRDKANELGLLIYPVETRGNGGIAAGDGESGTWAAVDLTVRCRAVVDGSYIDIAGFGLGADNMDKAGGKAGTYAFKQALVQAFLAGGADDTDDTDTPIKGGPRAPRPPKVAPPDVDDLRARFGEIGPGQLDAYRALLTEMGRLGPDALVASTDLRAAATAAKARATA